MSVEALAIVLNHSKASGTDKVVLLGIANHDGDGGAWPSVATLARYANVSERSVQYALNRLVESGEVGIHYNAGGTAQTRPEQRTNRYDILVACPEDCDRTTNHRVKPVAPTADGGEVDCTGGGEGGFTGGGDADFTGVVKVTAPEPSLNHPYEPSFEPPYVQSDDDDSSDELPPPEQTFDRQQQPTWTEQERTLLRMLCERIDISDFDGADIDDAIASVTAYWYTQASKPIPDWLVDAVRRRVATRDREARLTAKAAS